MKLLRLQNLETKGVYQVAYDSILLRCADEAFDRHPHPSRDTLLCDVVKAERKYSADLGSWHSIKWEMFHYGFGSLEQFRRWFYDDKLLNDLGRKGLALYVYEVKDSMCFIGHTQMVVDNEEFERVRNHPVTMFELDKIPTTL